MFENNIDWLHWLKDDTSKSSSTANELGLSNVGGVFVVLIAGMGVACVIAVCEFVWKSRKVATEERVIQMQCYWTVDFSWTQYQ